MGPMLDFPWPLGTFALGRREDETQETYRKHIETRSAEVVVNIPTCLIHQANYLLDWQIRRLEKAFLAEGGV